jgi:anti-sigma regulatory factor (Ser/Thr protein kinase)
LEEGQEEGEEHNMTATLTVSFKNQLAEIERLGEVLTTFAEQQAWPPKFLFETNIALEELLTNIILYGYEDDREHDITLRLSDDAEELAVELEDEGRAFNPLDNPDPDVTLSLEEREVGGLGIFLVRKFMTDLVYQRTEGKNRMGLKKKHEA